MSTAPILSNEDRAAVLEGERRYLANPLKHFRCSSEAQRQFLRHIPTCEVLGRAGNDSGKTSIGAGAGIGMARGDESLSGIALPQLPLPNVGWVLTQSYKQQIEASQKAYLSLLGDWPHTRSYVISEKHGAIGNILVATRHCKHGMNNPCQHCSKITFHCEESDSTLGGRVDWIHGDEIPKKSTWDEARMRLTAGRRLILFITATPLDDPERWGWVKADFEDRNVYSSRYVTGGDEYFGKPVRGRAEVRWTFDDNDALTPENKATLHQHLETSDLKEARYKGEYVNITGSCPFPRARLEAWLRRCVDPIRVETYEVKERRGLQRVIVEAAVQVWDDTPEPCFLVADPSLGIDDGQHDPAGFAVIGRRTRSLKRAFNGFLRPKALGFLAVAVARELQSCVIDGDNTGGYLEAFLDAVVEQGWTSLNRDQSALRYGKASESLGYTTTKEVKGEILSAINDALMQDDFVINSRDAVMCLMGTKTKLSPSGGTQVLRYAGWHNEYLTCIGRGLHLLNTRMLAVERQLEQNGPPSFTQLLSANGMAQKPRLRPGGFDGADWAG